MKDPRRDIDHDEVISTSYLVEALQEYWIDPQAREMWIRGIDGDPCELDSAEPGVEYQMASRVIMNLNFLRLRGKDPVTVHLHTCGGSYPEGMAIYDSMRLMPYHVTAISYTHARSMSSTIFQAADLRLCMPNSYVMIHNGTLELSGEYSTVISNARWAETETETMLGIYAFRAKGSKKFKGKRHKAIKDYIRDTMSERGDVFLSPREAIDWGLADGIFDGWNGDEVKWLT